MKKRLAGPGILAWITVLLLLLTSCESAPLASFSASPSDGSAPLTVAFTNTSGEADHYDWNFGDGNSLTTYTLAEPAQHEYNKAGTYTVNLTASKGKKPLTGSAALTVKVNPGAISTVTVAPANIELGIGETCEFSGSATDAFGNPITGANNDWQSDAGKVTNGSFTAGAKAGAFPQGVALVMEKDGVEVTGYADITILPDPLDSVSIVDAEVTAGQTLQMKYLAKDSHGNTIEGLDASWSLASVYQGSISENGLLTAGARTGSVSGLVQVEITDGTKTLTACGDVTVIAGPLARLGIAPDPVEVGIGMTQQMVAAGADEYGNRIADLTFTWEADVEAGSITADGLFTAGETPKTVTGGVTVTCTEGSGVQKVSVSVKVVPDRIIFISYPEDRSEDPAWFIIDADGSNRKQLSANSEALEQGACSSPDGRRIIYAESENLYFMDTTGNWQAPLLSGQRSFEPAFSPDGTRIAYQCCITDMSEIWTMDISGGNRVQLTNNSYYDDFPTWSPDGKQIAFASDRNGSINIYVMDSDGKKQTALTNSTLFLDLCPRWSPVSDDDIVFFAARSAVGTWGIYIVHPSNKVVDTVYSKSELHCLYADWAPDGRRIVFCGSDANSDALVADIFIINKTGSEFKTLLHDGRVNICPHFMPRMCGVTVTEASVVFKNTPSKVAARTAEELTSLIQDAVVRIETDLGTGSGFIIGSEGLILTNNHVVHEAETISVYLSDGSKYNGMVVGTDYVHDIAVIKIVKTGLHALEFKDTSSIKLAQPVIVLGYPLSKENLAVTSGLVSSIEYDSGRNVLWVQTDSAINPGNSGGPMLDMEGNVVGMVSAKLVGVSVEGVGFAISSNTLNTFLERLKAGEKIESFE